MKLAYDSDADVLYVTFDATTAPCSYVENRSGDILRINTETGKVVGCTIPFFLDRVQKDGEIQIPEIGLVPFNKQTLDLLHA